MRDFELAWDPANGGIMHYDGFAAAGGMLRTGFASIEFEPRLHGRDNEVDYHSLHPRGDRWQRGLPPSQYERLHWTDDKGCAALSRCPIVDRYAGAHYGLAVAYSEGLPRYRSETFLWKVLPGNRLQPPHIVLRWEWQVRVCIDPSMLQEWGVGASRLQGLDGLDRQEALKALYLRSIFVRRQRFDETDGVSRRPYRMNLDQRAVPGRMAVWYVRDWHDEQAIADIPRLDEEEAWPHDGSRREPICDPGVAMERFLLERTSGLRSTSAVWTVRTIIAKFLKPSSRRISGRLGVTPTA